MADKPRGGLSRAADALRREHGWRESVMSRPSSGERWQPEYEKEPALEPPLVSPEDLIGLGALKWLSKAVPAGVRATRGAVKSMRDDYALLNQPVRFAPDHGQYPKRIDDPTWQRLVTEGFNPDRPLLHGSPHPIEGEFIIDPKAKHTFGPAMYAAPVPKDKRRALSDTFAWGENPVVYPVAMREGKWLTPFGDGSQPGYYTWLESLGMDRQKLAERAQEMGYLGVDAGSEVAAFHPSSFAPLYGGERFAGGGRVSECSHTYQNNMHSLP